MLRAVRKSLSFLVVLTLIGVVAGVVSASPAAAAATTVIVGNGDIAPNGPWQLEQSSNTGTFGFVSGPATTPGGTGSLSMTIASGQHEWLNNYSYGVCATGPSCNSVASMTPIVNFDALGFSTYRASGSTMPSFNIEVYTTGVSSYTTLAFIPTSGSVVNSTWQTWDTMNPSDGVWYSSQDVGNGVFNCPSFSCSASWSQITASYPNAKVVYGLGPNLGTGGTFTGNIDNFVVGLSGTTTTYDFEPDCTTTCYVDAAGNDNNTGQAGDPLRTIQAGITKVQSGGTVSVAAGTYVENVVVNKSVTINGAGSSTIVEPAVSNPNCGGAGGASLCAGASNVFLVQANNVTIHNLVVDGDNPALTGLSIGGADVDARNGIITNHNAGTFNGLDVNQVTVKNIYLRGIYASSGGTFSFIGNSVDNVQGEAASIGIFNFLSSGVIQGNVVSNSNDAISANHSRGTTFSGNTITTSGSGVHTDNTGDSGGTLDTIDSNNVSSCKAGGYGVWAFVPYKNVTISNNTVSGCDVGSAALASCNLAGNNNCPGAVIPTVTFTNNSITGNGVSGGAGLYVTTNTFGFGDGDVKVSADHNTYSGAEDGVAVEETGTALATTTINRNSLAGTLKALRNAGATTVDAKCNWWGAPSPKPVANGLASGPVTVSPWLQESDLNSNCIPILSISDGITRVVEGNSGTTTVQLLVTLDRPHSQTVTAQWNTVDGAAHAGSDFVGASGTLTFTPGQVQRFISVDITGDTDAEDYEQFTVQLHDIHGAVPAGKIGPVTIVNDDKPAISVSNVSVTEGGVATFTATRDHKYNQPITISVSSSNGTAVASGDYNSIPGGTTITIPAGGIARSVTVQTRTDGLTEGPETFTVTFTGSSFSNSPVVATGTIQANNT